jgi:hypothetical protein
LLRLRAGSAASAWADTPVSKSVAISSERAQSFTRLKTETATVMWEISQKVTR